MKRKFYLYLFLVIGICSAYAQQVIVSDDASYTTPASGAILDVKSTSKGFMMPRVALASLTDQTTVASPATGLMVYNTGSGALTEKGVYFWNGTVWEKQLSAGASSTNYVKIGGDGTVTLNGDATTYNDLVVPVYSARNSSSTTPLWTEFAAPGFFTYEYIAADNAVDKELFFNVQLPHDYKEGSSIFPHVHWSSTVALGTTRPVWRFQYQWVNLNGNYSADFSANLLTGYLVVQSGGGVESTPANLTDTRRSMITPLGSISGTDKTVSSMLLIRLTRFTTDANDNFTGGAFILSFDLHYEIDSFGSSTEFAK